MHNYNLENMISIIVIILMFNYTALYVINDLQTWYKDSSLLKKSLATRGRRLALLIPPIALIVGIVLFFDDIRQWFKYLTTDWLSGKK